MQVFMHPPGDQGVGRNKKLDYPRPALAARYEPSTRVLALLAAKSAVPSAEASSSQQTRTFTIVFCVFSPDFRTLSVVAEEDVLGCSLNAAGEVELVDDPPFVLLPARKGSGVVNKVISYLSSVLPVEGARACRLGIMNAASHAVLWLAIQPTIAATVRNCWV